jgi:hypothetical protein
MVSFFAMDFPIYFKILYIYIYFIMFGAHFSDSIQLRVGTHILLYFLQWSAQYPPCKSWGKICYSKVHTSNLPTSSKVENSRKKARPLAFLSSASSPPFQRRKKNSVRSRNCLVAKKYTSAQIHRSYQPEWKTPCLLYNRFPDQKTQETTHKRGSCDAMLDFRQGMLLSKIALSLSQFHHVPTTESNID